MEGVLAAVQNQLGEHWQLASVLVGAVLVWLVLRLARALRSGLPSHADWASRIKFSSKELTVLRTLWQWQKSGHAPTGTTLSLLSPAEMAVLMAKIGLDNVPDELRSGDEEKKRAQLALKFENLGMDSVEAEITAGMIAGRLGPANDL